MRLVLAGCLLLGFGCTPEKQAEFKGKVREAAPDSPKYDDAFTKAWGDGMAEVSAYSFVRERDGVNQSGSMTAIYVQELLSNTLRVKAEPGRHPSQDEIPVMRFSLMETSTSGPARDAMLTTFVNTQPVGRMMAGSPLKISFSSQEWSGQLYKQALFDPPGARVSSHSFIDGEADQEKTVDPIEDGVSEDGLMLWARGLARPAMKQGEEKAVDLFLALERARQAQGPGSWVKAILRRGSAVESVKTPLGVFQVEKYEAMIDGLVKKTFWVEKLPPYRVVQYQSSTGVRSQLIRSERTKYWEKQQKSKGLPKQSLRKP